MSDEPAPQGDLPACRPVHRELTESEHRRIGRGGDIHITVLSDGRIRAIHPASRRVGIANTVGRALDDLQPPTEPKKD